MITANCGVCFSNKHPKIQTKDPEVQSIGGFSLKLQTVSKNELYSERGKIDKYHVPTLKSNVLQIFVSPSVDCSLFNRHQKPCDLDAPDAKSCSSDVVTLN